MEDDAPVIYGLEFQVQYLNIEFCLLSGSFRMHLI